jgi:hypothetical protein
LTFHAPQGAGNLPVILLKKFGDIGSHGKNLVQKQDIDQSQENIRFCIQELLSISRLSLKK